MWSMTLRRVGVLSLIAALSMAALGAVTLAIPPDFEANREADRTASAILEDSAGELPSAGESPSAGVPRPVAACRPREDGSIQSTEIVRPKSRANARKLDS